MNSKPVSNAAARSFTPKSTAISAKPASVCGQPEWQPEFTKNSPDVTKPFAHARRRKQPTETCTGVEEKGTSDFPSEVFQKPVPTVWQKSFAQVVTEKQSQQPPVVFMTLKSHRPVTADVPAKRGKKMRKLIPAVPKKTQLSVVVEEPPTPANSGKSVKENEASSVQVQSEDRKTSTPQEETHKPSVVPAENTNLQPAEISPTMVIIKETPLGRKAQKYVPTVWERSFVDVLSGKKELAPKRRPVSAVPIEHRPVMEERRVEIPVKSALSETGSPSAMETTESERPAATFLKDNNTNSPVPNNGTVKDREKPFLPSGAEKAEMENVVDQDKSAEQPKVSVPTPVQPQIPSFSQTSMMMISETEFYGILTQKDENAAALQQENSALKVEVMRLNKLLQQKNTVLSDATGNADQIGEELSHWRTLVEQAKSSLIQMQQQKSETEAALAQSQRLLKEKEEEHFKETTTLKYNVEQLKHKLQVEQSLMEKEKMLIYKGLHEKTRETSELTQKIHQLEKIQETFKETAEQERLQWQKEKSSFLQEMSQLKNLFREKEVKMRKSVEDHKKTVDQLHQEMYKPKEKNQEKSNLTSKLRNLETSLLTEKAKTNAAEKQQAEDKHKWDEEKSSLLQEISQLKEVIQRKEDRLNHCQELQEEVKDVKEKPKKKSHRGFLSFFKRSKKKE